MKPNEKIYLLTDLCMWEANKKNKTSAPHAIEVVDINTGTVHFIKSGSRITFVDGEITERNTQVAYNEESKKTEQKMPSDKQDMQKRAKRKGESLRTKSEREIESV